MKPAGNKARRLLIVPLLALSAFAQTLPPPRMPQSALHESMRRETLATIDRGRETLARNLRDASAAAALPGIGIPALSDPDSAAYSNIVAEAAARAFAVAEERISKPWETEFTAGVATAAFAEAMCFAREAPPRIVSRLTRADVRTLPPADAAILLLALESNGVDCRAKWRVLAETPVNAQAAAAAATQTPPPARVALSALCRMMAAPRGVMDAPPAAASAYLRWVWKRIDDADFPPEAAYYTALAASRLPRTVFVSENPPLPINWRERLASSVVARQFYDSEKSEYRWGANSADTSYAILTLDAVLR